jgi:hypothetical protein
MFEEDSGRIIDKHKCSEIEQTPYPLEFGDLRGLERSIGYT